MSKHYRSIITNSEPLLQKSYEEEYARKEEELMHLEDMLLKADEVKQAEKDAMREFWEEDEEWYDSEIFPCGTEEKEIEEQDDVENLQKDAGLRGEWKDEDY